MNDLLNCMRQQAGNVMANYGTPRVGIVDSYNPTSYTCVVRYQPEDSESLENSLSAELPIAAIGIGNGFGVLSAPNIGDRVNIIFPEGADNLGYVVGALFDSAVNIPPAINAGEIYLIHQSGTFIKFLENGDLLINGNTLINMTTPEVTITTTGNVNLNVGGDLNANVTGDAIVSGKTAQVTGTDSASVTAPAITLGDGTAVADALARFNELKAAYDAHVHSNGNDGNDTGAPTTPLPNSVATSVISGA